LVTLTLLAELRVVRLLCCERDVPLGTLMPPGSQLERARPQLSYVRAFSPAKQKLRGWQLVRARPRLSCVRAFSRATPMPRDLQAKSQLSYGRVSSSAKPKLPGWQLEWARPQLFSYGLS
jgi:hypothetical protein